MRRTLPCGVLLLAVLPACSSCETSELGRLAATERGDMSNAPAERARFDADLRVACGDGAMPPPGVLPRSPYVQAVTDTTAAIAWVSTGTAPESIAVYGPDRRELAVAPGEVDRTVQLPRGSQRVANVTGLVPGAIHCYEIRSGLAPIAGRFGFRAAPRPGAEVAVRLSAMGDFGLRTIDQRAVFAQLQSVPSELLLLTGDIAYEDGTTAELDDNVFGVYAAMMRSVPFFPSAGNHDYHTDSAKPLRQAFVLPGNGGAGADERWYAVDWGMLHVAVLDTEAALEPQAAWLDADLARSAAPWKIVVIHRPPYSSGHHGDADDVRRVLVPVFERRGVQLVLAGHEHHYERTHPIRGVTYVITGGGGRGTRPVGKSSFTAFSQQVAHFVHIVADTRELRLYAIDAVGAEFDTVRLPLREAKRNSGPGATGAARPRSNDPAGR